MIDHAHSQRTARLLLTELIREANELAGVLDRAASIKGASVSAEPLYLYKIRAALDAVMRAAEDAYRNARTTGTHSQ